MRIDAATLGRLERDSKKRGCTMSAAAADRLSESLEATAAMEVECGSPENRGLGSLITKLAAQLQAIDGLSWRDHPFVFQELVAGIDEILMTLGARFGHLPADAPKPPPIMGQIFPALVSSTGTVGRRLAGGLIDQLYLHPTTPEAVAAGSSKATEFARHFFELPAIFQDLGLRSPPHSTPKETDQ